MLLIGVSDENESLIEETFITKLGAKYPFVCAKGVNEQYRIGFFPSVYCIAPDGTILTVPDDRMPTEAFIEEQLANVSLSPKMPVDSRFDAIRSLWQKKEFKKLGDYLTKMLGQPTVDAELRTVYESQQAELQKRMERATARVQTLGKGPDFYTALNQLERLQKDWAGLPPADAANSELERFAKDAHVKDEIAASKALEKVVGKFDAGKVAQRRKLVEELEKFKSTKKYAGTHAAQQAEEMLGKFSTKG